MMRVYIAGPYTHPDPVRNIGKSLEVFNELMDLGFWPYSPHLISQLPEITSPRSYRQWMNHCKAYVTTCQVVLRLPGESSGADEETALAAEHQIPVVQWRQDADHVRTLQLLAAGLAGEFSKTAAERKIV